MQLGAAIDVVIGLAFTYLLLGILASAVQELVATWMNKRGNDLRDGIARLLAGTQLNGAPYKQLFERVFGHALIGDLSAKKLPSYVPARNFGLALLEALKDGSQAPLFTQIERSVAALPPGSAKESLTALVTRAAGDIDALQHGIETWFDTSMDRLSGVYKRFSQHFTLIFGLGVAVALNVDSIALTKALWLDQALRTSVVASAQHYIDQNAKAPGALQKTIEDAKAQIKEIDQLGLPIGWRDGDTPATVAVDVLQELVTFNAKRWLALLGWIITGLAVSLGAPFWFDSLQRLMRLRNTGPKPARTAPVGEGVQP